MAKTFYPRDDDHVYSDRCPNIRIGFTNSIYRELNAEDARRKDDIHYSSLYMADIAALLWKLPKSYRTLLFHIGAKIVVNKNHRNLASCFYKKRKICITSPYVEGFRFENNLITGSARAAHLSYTVLFEETAHYLVSALRFYQTPGYHAAMRREIKSLSPLQRGIMRLERAYSAAGNEGKRALGYMAPDNQPEELLIDLLRIKNYLAAQDFSVRDINSFMTAAFPHSWPFARQFERQVNAAARDIARQTRTPKHRPFRPHGRDHGKLPHLKLLMRQALKQAA